VAEAQILGVPVVATNVGGTSSMVTHGKDGFLFPATDPYMAAFYIRELLNKECLNKNMGMYANEIALKRHGMEGIINELKRIYSEIS
jgi:glycosyltransferase involved in cell wall biosynthesis